MLSESSCEELISEFKKSKENAKSVENTKNSQIVILREEAIDQKNNQMQKYQCLQQQQYVFYV